MARAQNGLGCRAAWPTWSFREASECSWATSCRVACRAFAVEKRLYSFIVSSLVIWGVFLLLQFYFSPPQQAQKNVAQKPDEKKVDPEKEQARPDDPKTPLPPVKAEPGAEDRDSQSPNRQRIALGSLDPATGYPLLVTFDNRGAAIERIELNGDRYHDLDDLSGYLGSLALANGKAGVVVGVVGPGTPAANAKGDDGSTGLKIDDEIISIGDKITPDVKTFEKVLHDTKPGDSISLKLVRSGKPITFTTNLIRRPLELIRPESNKGAKAVLPDEKIAAIGPPSYRLTLAQAGHAKARAFESEIEGLPSLFDGIWDVKLEEEKGIVEFSKTLSAAALGKIDVPTSLKIVKRYTMPSPTAGDVNGRYHVALDIEIHNVGENAESFAYRLEGPNGLPTEGWWYSTKVHPGWGGAGARDVICFTTGHKLVGNPELISESAKQVKAEEPPVFDLFRGAGDERSLRYLGVDTQYFASAIVPATAYQSSVGHPEFKVAGAFGYPINVIEDKKWAKTTNVSCHFDSLNQKIEPGQSIEDKYIIFAGPKIEDPMVGSAGTVSRYGMSPVIEYGWFRLVSYPLMQILRGLYWITGNFGIAIILLTVTVRMCLVPFSLRQAKSAAAMQAMAPEMAKVKEKYANDYEKQGAAQRELMAKHGVNPMGGCLLMFAQLPIFIGLYRCLAVDIDLREAALIPGLHWASNLAGPDELYRWKEYVLPMIGDEAHGWFGPYFNLLPIFSIMLFLVQQKLFSPPAIDEETKMQQKMMYFMTMFMGVMFYKVPAGLCTYIITSSLWGICERKLLPKPKPSEGNTEVTAATTPTSKTPPAAQKSEPRPDSQAATWLANLFSMADSQLKESKSTRKKEKKR